MLKFYEEIMSSFGFTIKDGEVYVGDKLPKKMNKLQMALPTPAILDRLTVLNKKTGKYDKQYELYHLFANNAIRDNISLTETKQLIETLISAKAYNVMMLLTKYIESNSVDGNMGLVEFRSSIELSKNVKKPIDVNWYNFLKKNGTSEFIAGRLKLMKFNITTGIEFKGGVMNKGAVLEVPILDELEVSQGEYMKENRLDAKHIAILKSMLLYIYKPWMDDNIIAVSNHDKWASQMVLLTTYKLMVERINSLLDDLSFLDMQYAKDNMLSVEYDVKDIDHMHTIDLFIPETGKIKDNNRVDPLTASLASTHVKSYVDEKHIDRPMVSQDRDATQDSDTISVSDYLASKQSNSRTQQQTQYRNYEPEPSSRMVMEITPQRDNRYSNHRSNHREPVRYNPLDELMDYGSNMTQREFDSLYDELTQSEMLAYERWDRNNR